MNSFNQFLAEAKTHKLHAVLKNYGYQTVQDASKDPGVTNYTHPRLDHTASVSDAGWTHSTKKQGGKTAGNLDKHLAKVHQAGLFEIEAGEI